MIFFTQAQPCDANSSDALQRHLLGELRLPRWHWWKLQPGTGGGTAGMAENEDTHLCPRRCRQGGQEIVHTADELPQVQPHVLHHHHIVLRGQLAKLVLEFQHSLHQGHDIVVHEVIGPVQVGCGLNGLEREGWMVSGSWEPGGPLYHYYSFLGMHRYQPGNGPLLCNSSTLPQG